MNGLTGRLWPAHPKPLPDELLSSWLVRIARANGLKLQTFCVQVFGHERQLWNRDIDRLAPAWLLRSLAQHTGTPLRRVVDTTLLRYQGLLYERKPATGQLRWILCAGMYHRKRQAFGTLYCPKCLAEDAEPYFRTRWRVAVLCHCAHHGVELLDRCPRCEAPVALHRQELGKPQSVESGPMSGCHICGTDLRDATTKIAEFYDDSVAAVSNSIADLVEGRWSSLNAGHMVVLHQLCRIMVSRCWSARLAAYVASMLALSPGIQPNSNARWFESRTIADRRHVIQLASWLLAQAELRIELAWKARAARYSDLKRDMKMCPAWFSTAIKPLREGLHNRSSNTAHQPSRLNGLFG